jgi:glucose-1-phosphate thymidylyltransferase
MAPTFKAVVLARGLGVRLRRSDPAAPLDQAQAAAAIAGLKGMVPLNGHPLLDYTLTALADAGYREVCLVVGPEHAVVREWYLRHARPSRLQVGFAIQAKPLGTADAVLAAEGFAGADRFLVVNADNYYPVEALQALRLLESAGIAAFTSAASTRAGNIPAERVARFPTVTVGADGALDTLREPDAGDAALQADALVSMNCWMFTAAIFRACRAVAPSASGELELPEAVRVSVQGGERYRVLPFDLPVLDLTARADVASLEARLAGVAVRY